MEIGEAAVLAKLPRAGLTGDGQIKFRQVYGIRNQQRKKRHEICAAVDGNSVNIIEVVNGRNLASWPVPPDSTFVSEPYSERVHVSNDSFVRRSWCAVQRRGKTSIHYYEQTNSGSETSVSTKSHDLTSSAPVLVIQSANTAVKDVLTLQEDGSVTVFSSDGASIKHRGLLKGSENQLKILAAQTLPSMEAQSSVLKSRQDLALTLSEEVHVIAAAYQNGSAKSIHLGIWVLAASTSSIEPDTSLEPLLRHELDKQTSGPAKKASVEFIHDIKMLEITTGAFVRTFDITTIVPQRLSERKHPVPDSLSSLDLNPDITLYLNPGKLQVYNRKFNALQASSSLSAGSLKRKRDSHDTSRSVLVAYFARLNRVLLCSGSQLLAVDIHSKNGSSNPFKGGSLLIGSILRGNNGYEDTNNSSPDFKCSIGRTDREQQTNDWSIISKDLDNLAEQNDVKGFEERFRIAFKLQSSKDLISPKTPGSKIQYLLSKIFAYKPTSSDVTSQPIKVVLLLPQLLLWCISSGLLEESRIAKALQLNQADLSSTAVAQALLEVDPQLSLAEYYVRNSPFIQPQVLVFVAKSLVSKALQQSEQGISHKRTDSSGMEVDVPVPGHQLMLDSRPDRMAASTPTHTCLAYVLKRLARTGTATVSSQLRTSSLEQRELLALIQFLRQQLFLGGYSRLGEMRKYPSPPPSNADKDDEDNMTLHSQISLQGIVVLLNSCVDALGPVGILGSAEEGAFIEKMVQELLSEVESACQAVEDSTSLQGIVRETLRYAESVERQPFEVRSTLEKRDSDAAGKGQIVTLYAEADAGEPGSLSGSALPLSLKAEEDIDKLKVREGGQTTRRSAREIGMLKDRLKSPYSFERLVL